MAQTLRAVFRDGGIQLIDPIPGEWVDGMTLAVEPLDRSGPDNRFDEWFNQLEPNAADISPQLHASLEEALHDQDHHAKRAMRGDMGV